MKLTADILEIGIETACAHISGLDERFSYHDLVHTTSVVEKVNELSKRVRIEKQQRLLLAVAAWFHDTGYTRQVDGHEVQGAALAEDFLREYNIQEEEIETIKGCILSTRYPQQPVNLLQQVICDADMSHLATKDFVVLSEKLRKEWQFTRQLNYTDQEWLQLNINFLERHRYHTAYAKEFFEPKKQKNIELLKKKSQALLKKDHMRSKRESEERKATDKPGRGVETVYRTASGNHIRLSAMADNKAHILLSINSIIISVILTVLARKLTEAPFVVLPTILLLCVSVTTIVFAVLTTKPKVSKGVFTEEQVSRREVNLLFFGNFHRMDLEIFERGMEEVISDKDYLYKSMTRDIYYLGKVLAIKYRYLNIGYRVFMYGLIVSVIVFAVSFLMYNPAV